MTSKQWSFGDRVIHTLKPEWGAGQVTSATSTTHEGRPCQSLTIRFERGGVKTISTAFANLVSADDHPGLLSAASPSATDADGEIDPFAAKIGSDEARASMLRIAEDARDPFAPLSQRFEATVRLFRFAPTGRSLLDWATAQSGLADPMSRFNRHELEQFFQQWTIVRDNHLKKLVQEFRKADPAGLQDSVRKAPPAVQQTLRRLDPLR